MEEMTFTARDKELTNTLQFYLPKLLPEKPRAKVYLAPKDIRHIYKVAAEHEIKPEETYRVLMFWFQGKRYHETVKQRMNDRILMNKIYRTLDQLKKDYPHLFDEQNNPKALALDIEKELQDWANYRNISPAVLHLTLCHYRCLVPIQKESFTTAVRYTTDDYTTVPDDWSEEKNSEWITTIEERRG